MEPEGSMSMSTVMTVVLSDGGHASITPPARYNHRQRVQYYTRLDTENVVSRTSAEEGLFEFKPGWESCFVAGLCMLLQQSGKLLKYLDVCGLLCPLLRPFITIPEDMQVSLQYSTIAYTM